MGSSTLSPMDSAQPSKGTPTWQPSEQGRYESGPESRGHWVLGGRWVSQTHRPRFPVQSAQRAVLLLHVYSVISMQSP